MDDIQIAVENVKRFAKVLKQNNYFVDKALCQKLLKDIWRNDGGLDTMIQMTCGPENATKFFQNCGYDGIMNLDVLDFVAYYPGQIKMSLNKAPTSAISTIA
jgi:heterodisulfide reductase subunit A-like polyferredoxin